MNENTQQAPNMDEQDNQQTEPSNLGEAMQMVGEANTQTSETSVPTEEDAPREINPDTDGREQYIQSSEQSVSDTGYSNTGRHSNGYTQTDYNNAINALSKNVQDAAKYYANESFKQQGIGTFSLNELYQASDDGVVTFINPDNPNRPFESRAQAQEWCDAWNKQVVNEYKTTVARYEQELLQEQLPSLQLIAFAPEMEKMDDITSDIFNELLSSHEVYDSDGDVVGYDVDLYKTANRAAKMAKNFATTYENNKARANVQTPAVDIKSSSSGQGSGLKSEPKNLGEAMQMYEMSKKGKK